MGRLLKWIGGLALILLVVMQFARPARVHRRIDPSQTIEAVTGMPTDVSATLQRSCGNCHSEHTDWRWYSNVAPVSWLQMADVGMARDAMNFSHWSVFSPAQQKDRLEHICRMARSGDMPPWYYKPLHPKTWLTSGDVDRICQWTQTQARQLPAASETDPPKSP